jgi:hypothetical protein
MTSRSGGFADADHDEHPRHQVHTGIRWSTPTAFNTPLGIHVKTRLIERSFQLGLCIGGLSLVEGIPLSSPLSPLWS